MKNLVLITLFIGPRPPTSGMAEEKRFHIGPAHFNVQFRV